MTVPRPLALPLLLALALAVTGAAQGELAAMRDLVQRGFWHSATQVNGPELVARFPDDAEAHFLYATTLFLIGDLTEAEARLSVAAALVADAVPASHLHLGALILAERGEPAPAARQLRDAFELRPSYAYAMDWGRIAWQAGLMEEALEAFAAAAATPEGERQAWPHLAIGRVLAAQGHHQRALAAFRSALEVYETYDIGDPRPPGPEYVEAWFRSGVAHEALGQVREAEAAYRAARSVDPNHAPSVQAVDRLTRRAD